MIVIREAWPQDLETLVRFQKAMASETEGMDLDPVALERGISALLLDSALGRYYIAEENQRSLGCLMITSEWSDWRSGWVWWIQSVWVEPSARGRGVYKALYEHIRTMAEARPSIRGIRLYVDRRNTAAQEVYTRLGMDGDHYRVFEWMK